MNNITFRYEKFEFDQPLSPTEVIHVNYDKLGNLEGIDHQRFRFSQVVDSMLYYYQHVKNTEETINIESIDSVSGNKYIIPIAVAYNPNDWTDTPNGVHNPNQLSVFEYLNPKYIKDMQDKNALLMLDQSVEGYHSLWLWSWFHNKCQQYNITPASIIYLTGDQSSADSYEQWCNENNPSSRLKVIPSTSLGMYVHKQFRRDFADIKFDNILEHKKLHYNDIYLYDCINMRPRPQRVLNLLHLFNAGLLEYGNITMGKNEEWHMTPSNEYLKLYNLPVDIMSKVRETNAFDKIPEPKSVANKDNHYYNFVERILYDMYKNSWLSIVAETSYFEYGHATFISEKTFKPLASMQPFIIVGMQGTLKYLRKLGYKTFHPYIDESYDDLPDNERFAAIAEAIKKVQAIENKAEWYESMRGIVEHNYNLFASTDTRKSQEHDAVVKYYVNYFKE